MRLPRLPQLPPARREVLGPALIVGAGLLVVAAVWVLTGWWSLSEQTGLAELRGFAHPAVLFWASDALAIGCALVALAAALDNRPAPLARIGYGVALAGSAYLNAEAATARLGEQLTPDALVMAAGVPLASFAALEIILAAIRATVRRWRGLPAPAGAPALRLGRLLLGGWGEWTRWRRAYLDATRPDAVPVVLADQLRADSLALTVTQTSALREYLARELDQLVAAVRDELAEQLPAAPAVDADQLARELDSRLDVFAGEVRNVRQLATTLAGDLRRDLRELDSRLEALPRPTPAPRPRPAPAGDADNDTARMRAYWDAELDAGRIPSGADLDRHVGRDPAAGYGRQLRKRWLAEGGEQGLRIVRAASAGA